MLDLIKQTWAWYFAGTVIGLTVPTLLLIGNKTFGISSSLRHICAACLPSKIPYFQYNWRKEVWNLYFVGGILIGGFIAEHFLTNPNLIEINPQTVADLKALGIRHYADLMPIDLFNFQNLFTLKGFIFIVLGGFLVGFGTRYAGGCTSGHAIMGLSNLQLPSLIASISFMIGGILMANYGLPLILNW